jgi:hypothetical protein
MTTGLDVALLHRRRFRRGRGHPAGGTARTEPSALLPPERPTLGKSRPAWLQATQREGEVALAASKNVRVSVDFKGRRHAPFEPARSGGTHAKLMFPQDAGLCRDLRGVVCHHGQGLAGRRIRRREGMDSPSGAAVRRRYAAARK